MTQKFACVKTSGDCHIGARDKNGFCLHQKYCSWKKAVPFNEFIIDRKKEKEIEEVEYKPKTAQQQTLF